MQSCSMRIYRLGHGLCVLLYGVKDDGKPYHAVIDCGSRKELRQKKYNAERTSATGDIITTNAVQDIVNKIRESGSGHLDLLVSSHQDDDHNNLIYELLNRLNGWGRTPKNDKDTWIGESCERMVNTQFQTVRKVSIQEGSAAYSCRAQKMGAYIEFEQTYADECSNSMMMKVSKNDTFYDISLNVRTEIIIVCEFVNDAVRQMHAELAVSLGQMEKISIDYADDIPDFWKRCQNLALDMAAECEKRSIDNQVVSYISRFIKNSVPGFKSEFYMENKKMGQQYFQAHLFQPGFQIDHIILGGGDEGIGYVGLENFLYDYAEIKGTEFLRYKDYAFLTIRNGEIADTQSQIDYRGYGKSVYEMQGQTLTVFGEIHESGDAVIRNATSTILNFVYQDPKSVLFPADTTAHHFGRIAAEVTADVTSIIAPHHGSYNTTFVFDENKNMLPDDRQPLCTLYSKIKPAVTYLSECYCNTSYRLPRLEFLRKAEDHAIEDVPGHPISYFSSASNLSHTVSGTTKSIYNTGNLWMSNGECYDYMETDLMQDPPLPVPGNFPSAGNRISNADRPEHLRHAVRKLPPDRLFV